MRVRKNSAKYPSEYVYIKNDKLAYIVGFLLLAVTAIATILGITPQDVKQFSHTWWYELIINIVAIVVLIGLQPTAKNDGDALGLMPVYTRPVEFIQR